MHYELSPRIHSDQGRDFESKLIRELLNLLGVRKSRTTPYHPQGDPQLERFNRTLLSLLGTMGNKKKLTGTGFCRIVCHVISLLLWVQMRWTVKVLMRMQVI